MSLPSRITSNLLVTSPFRTVSSAAKVNSIRRATIKNRFNNTAPRSFQTTTRNMTVTAITSLAQFHEVIASKEPVVIDCWATWCGPCRVISPIFEKLSQSVQGVHCYKVDVDEQPEISEELGVRAMPTFFAFKDGNKVGNVVGADPTKLTSLMHSL